MFMAPVTGIICICIGMAILAFCLPLITMIDWELVADKLRWVPARGHMAIFTREPKIAGVDLRLKVTGRTRISSIFVQITHMAILAAYLCMTSIQREDIRMGEIAHTVDTIMALKAVIPVLGLMQVDESLVILSVTEGAGLGCEFRYVAPMTTSAGDRGIGEIFLVQVQTEFRLISVIKGLPLKKSWLPGSRIMAGGAILGEGSQMNRRFSMTVSTIARQTGKLTIYMAVCTTYFKVIPS